MFITLSQNLTKFFHEEGTMHGLLYENKIGYTARKIFRNNKTQNATIEVIDVCFLLTVERDLKCFVQERRRAAPCV